MRVLLHICCGPCAIMPLQRLLDEGHEVGGFFYNPNIHPLAEYLRRREGAAQVAEKYGLKMIWAMESADYDAAAWLGRALSLEAAAPASSGEGLKISGAGQKADPRPAAPRCRFCWAQRLERTRAVAAQHGFDAFSSSLLYSRWQKHEEIAGLGAALAAGKYPGAESSGADSRGAPAFLYRDFRVDWQRGIEISKAWSIYRQQYCGCLLSESERYARDLAASNRILGSA